MCFKLFKKKSLPYPEEKPDFSQTIETVNIAETIVAWLTNYRVPAEYRDFWRTKISVTVDATVPCACAWGENGTRHIKVHPAWLNTGVIAHEQAHNSYALMSEAEKQEFSNVYTLLKVSDPKIRLLYSINSYGLTNDIEAHAEIYRFWGDTMPEALKPFYPKLLEV